MDSIIGQISYPVFMYLVWLFFVISSVFAFAVGLGLALHRQSIQRISAIMNRWVSLRKWMKPLSIPRTIEPALLAHPVRTGFFLAVGATASVLIINGLDAQVFHPLYDGVWPTPTVSVLSGFTRDFLLTGNILVLLVGLLLMLAPHWLSRVIAYSDQWYSVRKRTRTLAKMHLEVDEWVLAHAKVSGLALIVMSLGLMAASLPHI